MAKCIYICSREKLPASIESHLQNICKRLAPDNITPAAPKIIVNDNIAYGIMNPTKTILESGNSLLMGQLFNKNEKWAEPLQEFPDGSYALFRDGKEYCEIVADAVGSRTIWYYLDENLFVAATSQRAILMLVGNFEFDERVIPWMLSTGSLGPSFSWDKRIKRVPADSSVILNKKDWSVTSKSNPIEFNLAKRSDEEHKKKLTAAITTTFKSLDLDFSSWALPLSGGYDSRAILCLFHQYTNVEHLRTVTWGLESSLHIKGNDAYVAKELANELNVSHKYYNTDLSDEPVDQIINRFVLLGEGRIDHLSAYMDGFKIWKTLFEDGIEGTIRGDESFGWTPVYSPLHLKIKLGCALCSDFSNLKDYTNYGLPLQELPQYLNQRKGESLNVWRDRLYQEYRMPVFQAALADLKFPYVEQISPFFSKPILSQARQLPDRLRTDKALFKKIAISMSPKIDYATTDATASPGDILKQKRVVDFLKNELSSADTKKLFPAEFLDIVLTGIKSENKEKSIKANSFSIKSFIKGLLPHFIKTAIQKIPLQSIDHNMLAFRIFLASKMHQVLNEDSSQKTSSKFPHLFKITPLLFIYNEYFEDCSEYVLACAAV